MRFLADMGISEGVVNWLRIQSHDVTHLREEGLQRLPNGEIFSKALAEQRAILAFDLDFGETVALSRGEVTGVVVFRLNNTRTPFVIDRLRAALPAIEAPLQEGAIVVVQDGRYRIRRLPRGS